MTYEMTKGDVLDIWFLGGEERSGHWCERLWDEVPSWKERARAIGLRRGWWPYGPNADLEMRFAMVEWAERHRMRYVETTTRACPHWVIGKRLGSHECPWWSPGVDEVWDHPSHWRSVVSDARVLLIQPYATEEMVRAEVEPVCNELGISYRIDPGWYGVGGLGTLGAVMEGQYRR